MDNLNSTGIDNEFSKYIYSIFNFVILITAPLHCIPKGVLRDSRFENWGKANARSENPFNPEEVSYTPGSLILSGEVKCSREHTRVRLFSTEKALSLEENNTDGDII